MLENDAKSKVKVHILPDFSSVYMRIITAQKHRRLALFVLFLEKLAKRLVFIIKYMNLGSKNTNVIVFL